MTVSTVAAVVAGCLGTGGRETDEEDNGRNDNDDTEQEDGEEENEKEREPEHSFKRGAPPDEGEPWLETEDRYLTEFSSGIYEIRFVEEPSEDTPAVVRISLVSAPPTFDDGEALPTPADRMQVKSDGLLWEYEAREVEMDRRGMRMNELDEGEHGGMYLVPINNDEARRYDDEECWRVDDLPETPDTVELEFGDEFTEEDIVWQDYALLSGKDENCLPTGTFYLPALPTQFLDKRNIDPDFHPVISVIEERRRPNPSESRYYDEGLPETYTGQGGIERTLYHAMDGDERVFIEPSKEVLERPEDSLEFTFYNYTNESVGISTIAPGPWEIYRLEDGEWSDEPAEVYSAPTNDDILPTGSRTGRLSVDSIDGTHPDFDGTLVVSIEGTSQEFGIDSGTYAFGYTGMPVGFIFEVVE